jgi:multidrug efflux pump subunit AcrA (membrane-fusion protein)
MAGDEIAEAKIELARIEAQLRQRQIRSPIDGIVIDIHRKRGEYLAANDPRFVTVVDVSRLRSRFFVSTEFAEALERGAPVELFVGAKRARMKAQIEFVSPITESESGTVRVDVLIDNAQQKWRSGVVCELAGCPEQADSARLNSASAKAFVKSTRQGNSVIEPHSSWLRAQDD